MVYLGYQEFPVDLVHERLMYLGCDELAKIYRIQSESKRLFNYWANYFHPIVKYKGDVCTFTLTA